MPPTSSVSIASASAAPPGAFADRRPPYSPEAELAVLGGMFIDADAVVRAVEILDDSMFYREAHRRLYRAMVRLWERGEAVDEITLSDELKRTDDFDTVGGAAFLAQLLDAVPTAANLEYHAHIVRDKALLRRLIETATSIIQDTFEAPSDVETLLDEAEQKIFRVAQSHDRRGFIWIKEILWPTFERIEQLQSNSSAVTGVPTGFTDLDELTAGFQPSDLIVIAGRPSMGKTAFTLNIAEHAAISGQLPVAIFSLEMSKEALVQRVLCAEGRVDAGRLRRGRLMDDEYARLATAAGYLNTAPLYIDDTPGVSVLETRAKARRLKADRPDLAMVIVDYLQLMQGPARTENRQQEVSEISRGLKSLAKELDLPVVAISQLSRAVESRPDKRPMMSDLRECVTGDTLVVLADGRRIPIRNLVGTEPEVQSVNPAGRLLTARSDRVWRVGVRPVREVRLASGRRIRATAEHRLLGAKGWVRVADLAPGDRLAITRRVLKPCASRSWPEARLALPGPLMGDGSYLSGPPQRFTTAEAERGVSQRMLAAARETSYGGSSHFGSAPSRSVLAEYTELLDDDELRAWSASDLFWDTVVEIVPVGEEEVFDLTVPGPACWVADGIVSHNSGAIEQDADLIMFLYRPEYYFGPSDKDGNNLVGKAELIVAKQRNGATGTVDLVFQKEFTRFESFSRRTDDAQF